MFILWKQLIQLKITGKSYFPYFRVSEILLSHRRKVLETQNNEFEFTALSNILPKIYLSDILFRFVRLDL